MEDGHKTALVYSAALKGLVLEAEQSSALDLAEYVGQRATAWVKKINKR